MDPIESGSLRIAMRRYGPTVHLILAGEVDQEAGAAVDRVWAGIPQDVAVVACDLHHVSFMDAAGLHHLLALQRWGRGRGVTVLVYNWQSQPQRLLRHLISLPQGRDQGLRSLRSMLREHSQAQLALGVTAAGERDRSLRVRPVRRSARDFDPGPPPAAR
ncbi:STAS domain-containing protein [Streptomyces sp. NPDC091268]|uniref:STAS domain-containing protein n=1 Tax=Streptomyces sp. NPDC091268 TaxID=3365979 RepID=UPI0037F7089F